MIEALLMETLMAAGGGALDWNDFSSVAGATMPSRVATKAPNGDSCVLLDNAGASCMRIDLTDVFKGRDFTIGFYINPTSFTGTVGSTPSRGVAIELGPFLSNNLYFYAAPVNSGYEGDGVAQYPMSPTPVNQWSHIALSLQLSSKKLTGFVNGVPVSRTLKNIPANFNAYFGGIGDRSGYTGSAQGRYGYRGLMSEIHVTPTLIDTTFDPLTFPQV